MKIRNGFVSNSSSSSFLILFPKEINNYDELFNLMWNEKNSQNIQRSWNFKKNEKFHKEYNSFINEGYNDIKDTWEDFQEWATNVVLRDIKDQGPNNYLKALSTMSQYDAWYDNNELHYNDIIITDINELDKAISTYDKIQNQIDNFDWNLYTDEYYEELDNISNSLEYAKKLDELLNEIKIALKTHPNYNIFYTFSFADEDGTYFSIMEHGGVFGDLPAYVESFH